MKILVTGGTVFASRYTAEYFTRRGNEVYVLNRGNSPQSEGVHHIRADRHAPGNALKNIRFDAVLDITAYNENDVRLLHEALGEYGVYVFVSSSAVYPETLPQPFSESQECGANSIWGAYGTDKLAAEKYITANVHDSYIIRPPYLYGPMNNLYREAFVFECAEKDLPFYVPGSGDMKMQFFHIDDMCRFIGILINERPAERIFNVGSSEMTDILTWAELCYRIAGKTPQFVHVDKIIPQRSYFPFYDYEYELDVSLQQKYMKDTLPLSEGLSASYEWYKNNRELVRRKPLLDYISEHLEKIAENT